MADADTLSDLNDPSNQVTEQEKLLALSAQNEYEKRNYTGALQFLEKLEQSRPQDPKVLHNKTVVEFHERKLVYVQALWKTLSRIAQQLQCNLEDPQTLHDVDQCYVFFNEAVTLYHLRQYASAAKILLQIFTLVEQLDENLAKQVCFLLAEVLLRLEFPRHCLNLLQFMETSLLSRGSKLKSSLEKDKENEKDKEGEKDIDRKLATEESPIAPSIQTRLRRMKVRAYLSMRDSEAASRELDLFPAAEREDPAVCCLQSHADYLQGNRQSHVMKNLSKLLQANSNLPETGESNLVAYFNNLGCAFQSAGKHALACLNFQKALAANDEAFSVFPKPASGDALANRPLHTIATNYKYEILYNLGVSLLQSGKGTEAFDCLIETMQLYHTDPLLWLRLAECCIQVHKPDNSKDFRSGEVKPDFVKTVVGSGIHRKLILSPRVSNEDVESSDDAAFPVPTLGFAALCLKNAEHLLADINDNNPPEKKDVSEVKGKPDLNIPLSRDQKLVKKMSLDKTGITAAVAANSAYVSLCLGDSVSALQYAEQLLTLPSISGAQKLLGHLYAAESFVLLNRVSEALQHLQPDNISDLALTVGNATDSHPFGRIGPVPKWFPDMTQTGKAILQYNLSAAYALRGEYDKSSELLRQLWTAKNMGCDVPPQVVTLALYIELRLGRYDAARAIVKQHCPQYRC